MVSNEYYYFGEKMNHVLKAGLFLLLVGCGAADNTRDDPNNGAREPEVTRPEVGSEVEFKPLERSMIRRVKGVNRPSYAQVKASLSGTGLPVVYQTTPTPTPTEATPVEMIPTQRLSTDCGVSKDDTLTINQRIIDCQSKIGQRSSTTWSAFVNGISGEGNWFLVTYIDKLKVWQDASTGLLWSDIVKAGTFVEALGRDPQDLERDILSVCSSLDDNRKAALGNLPVKQVKWRLPNREEFLQADINGAKSVLTDSGTNLWTASYHEDNAGDPTAWSIEQKSGILKSTPISESLNIRCIGVITE